MDNSKKTDFIKNAKTQHTPVMMLEVLRYLQPKNGEVILDATFGAGGYTKTILDNSNCDIIATDRDINVKIFADEIERKYKNRFKFYNLKFSEIKDIIQKNSLDGIVLDLGVSSMQLDNAERGFSFNKDAPLNMTMGKNNLDAYEIINNYEENNIADIIYNYGEENKSRQIAKKIIQYRKNKKIETTVELANIIRSCFPENKYTKIDYATKSFQAIRIFVNEELKELETILKDSIKLLKTGGRLVVVSFHSLEDRIVKNFFNKYSDNKIEKINKYKDKKKDTIFKILTKHAVIVSEKEINSNKRARSAKLRGVVKC